MNTYAVPTGTVGDSGTIKSRFTKLDAERSTHLERARLCATVTIPSILPPEGTTENDALPTPYQGLGARAVNNLSSKMLLAILPPNSPFFKQVLDHKVAADLRQMKEDIKEEIETKLVEQERQVQDFIETSGIRNHVFIALRQCIVVGDACLYIPKDDTPRTHRLDNFVIQRDPSGNVVEFIIRERIALKALDKKVQKVVSAKVEEAEEDKPLEIYTRGLRDGDYFIVEQEIQGESINAILGVDKDKYPVDASPWIFMRWSSEGENYGRSHVEEYLGDFLSLESLSKSIVEGTAAAAKVIFLVAPNGGTHIDDLVKCRNTGFVLGNRADVEALKVDKANDFSTAFAAANRLEERLSQAFLLRSSVQRQAERVTAEEIRYMAQELEDSLGGIYSMFAMEFQLPLVRRVLDILAKRRSLVPLPKKAVRPLITTGLEALGRGHDLQKLMAFKNILDSLGPVGAAHMNMSSFLTRVANGLGLDTTGLIKSEEQVAQEQQAAAAAQMGQEIAPVAIKAMASSGPSGQ